MGRSWRYVFYPNTFGILELKICLAEELRNFNVIALFVLPNSHTYVTIWCVFQYFFISL
jgi:hypothetical protein